VSERSDSGSASLAWMTDEGDTSRGAGPSSTDQGPDAKTPPVGDNLRLIDFANHKRFSVRRKVGTGGMGVVYEALDRERGEWVALKTLLGVSPLALYRFKREFRALADVSHPNVINLHELFSDGEQIFFTMEFVDGVDFVEYVRGADPDDPETHAACHARLRAALRQLASGLGAIHASGKLHRDIKPSNVLVTAKGRVVLLDFGLVSESVVETLRSSGGDMVGTPAYVSPEQAGGGEASVASDWYAVGTMVFLALTGELPFRGKGLAMLLAKQEHDPKPPSELVAGIPEDLERLCLDLLARDPSKRPGAKEVLQRLGESKAAPALDVASQEGIFVGRAYHLRLLKEAFDATQRGRPVAIHVYGRSGMGKTSLVRRFLAQLRQGDGAVVLQGRCYERESVSFKALDSLIDSLCNYLTRLPDARAAELMPRDIQALARVFPVLQRVQAVADAPRRSLEIPDPRELRRRAFAALKELLARIADRRSLILHIDDLQWGDRDSAMALADLLRPPEAPALLLILSYRSESLATSSLFRSLLEHVRAEVDIRELEVGPLSLEDAAELAQAWIGRDGRQPRSDQRSQQRVRARQIARESGGSPLFVHELVRYAEAGGEAQVRRGGEVLLEQVVEERLGRLSGEGRRLVELIAIFGGPILQRLALRAARIAGDGRDVFAMLRNDHLVNTFVVDDAPMVEIYHDRVREVVRGRLGTDLLRERHRDLAFALEATGDFDSDTLAVHFREAGEWERAGDYAQVAAEQAAEALAFDRAARLYRLALELKPHSDPRRSELLCQLADALANGGRGGRAAKIYLEAAEMAPPERAIELRRRAAEQYLRSGHVADGLAALRAVLEAIGLELPESARAVGPALLFERMRLRLRGLGTKPRDPAEIAAADRLKMSVLRSAASGMTTIDPVISSLFQIRHLHMALKTGDAYEVACALATEVGFVSIGGERSRERTDKLVQLAEAAVQKVDDPYPRGLLAVGRGFAAFHLGDFPAAMERFAAAEEVLRNECVGVSYEITLTESFRLMTLFFRGRIREMAESLGTWLIEARERDDLWAETTLVAGPQCIRWLAVDDHVRARGELGHASGRWSEGGFAVQRLWTFIANIHVDLYAAEGLVAWRRLTRRWEQLTSSYVFQAQWYRILLRYLRACAALAVLCGGKGVIDREGLLGLCEEDIRSLDVERAAWGRPLADLVRASLASLRGRTDAAIEALRSAEEGFGRVDMALHGAVARRLRGILVGGELGAEMIVGAEAFMTEQGITNPRRMSRMLAPAVEDMRPAVIGRVPPRSGE